jgi:hypothetical protein
MFESFNKQIEGTIKELKAIAEAGNADAQHHLSILLFAEAMEKYDVGIFDRAESYLIKSAENGWPEAINDLNSQKIRRYAFEQRVARKKAI